MSLNKINYLVSVRKSLGISGRASNYMLNRRIAGMVRPDRVGVVHTHSVRTIWTRCLLVCRDAHRLLRILCLGFRATCKCLCVQPFDVRIVPGQLRNIASLRINRLLEMPFADARQHAQFRLWYPARCDLTGSRVQRQKRTLSFHTRLMAWVDVLRPLGLVNRSNARGQKLRSASSIMSLIRDCRNPSALLTLFVAAPLSSSFAYCRIAVNED